MFADTPTDADCFEPRHDDHQRAIDDLDLDPGECRRADDTPTGRSYHLRVGDLYQNCASRRQPRATRGRPLGRKTDLIA
ncbi:hypothetical protein EXE41_09710 [Halorubrum sp. SD690R]|uniref:hypothetical protein n=1 Tax=Halorubrum sp. SD690R TaxID=2518117 RepID=UPI0010F5E9D7|nr:hypothetical protein [Halorubrum sp. SD690R]TKX46464.1 hypothetical protein EXE41_09710 [Halorubrum sp. SD690R]